jgi:hypothetical protein
MQPAHADRELTLDRFGPILKSTGAADQMAQFLEGYVAAWNQEAPPGREDLPLRLLAPFLPNLTIMQRDPTGDLRYRLVGTGVVERMTRDLTGEKVFDYLAEEIHPGISQAFAAIIEDQCAGHFIYENIYSNGMLTSIESLLLPLASHDPAESAHIIAWHVPQEVVEMVDRQEMVFKSSHLSSACLVMLGTGTPDLSDLKALAPVTLA